MNVLMFHFVSSDKDSNLFRSMQGVTINEFEEQLSILTKNGLGLMEEDIKNAALTSDYPEDKYFYLTFDDGFKQHYDNVYPVLKDYGIQASFFVPTMALETVIVPTVEKQRLLQYNLFSEYQEFLGCFCRQSRNYMKSNKRQEHFYPEPENIKNSENYLKKYSFYSNEERFFRKLRNEYLSIKEFTGIIDIMFGKFYNNDKQFIDEYYMSISDLKDMNKNGMIIGGHSYSHPFLNKIPVSEMQIEIDKSIKYLRNTVANDINSFAYPYGAFDDNIVEHLKNIKIDYAFDTRPNGNNEQFNIRRNDVATYFKIKEN
jgi:peptidoglycan/xylan/chitin deacetylase (PgdA/CDA1 family)